LPIDFVQDLYYISLGSLLDQIESTLVNVDYSEKVALGLRERLKLPREIKGNPSDSKAET
jgi:hypothetical protein